MADSIRCRIVGWMPFVWLGAISLMTMLGIPLTIDVVRGGPDSPGPVFAIFWLGILAWFWYVALVHISYEIRLSPEGEIEFKSVLRKIRMNAQELTYIGPAYWLDPYTVVFRSTTRAARSTRTMENFSLLISELRRLNPDIRLRGI